MAVLPGPKTGIVRGFGEIRIDPELSIGDAAVLDNGPQYDYRADGRSHIQFSEMPSVHRPRKQQATCSYGNIYDFLIDGRGNRFFMFIKTLKISGNGFTNID